MELSRFNELLADVHTLVFDDRDAVVNENQRSFQVRTMTDRSHGSHRSTPSPPVTFAFPGQSQQPSISTDFHLEPGETLILHCNFEMRPPSRRHSRGMDRRILTSGDELLESSFGRFGWQMSVVYTEWHTRTLCNTLWRFRGNYFLKLLFVYRRYGFRDGAADHGERPNFYFIFFTFYIVHREIILPMYEILKKN